ncbi:MAG TPA: RNA-binding cell elongation regulator Jag/EloR [Dehalococcoidales bacterium]|nr:RNA-binding cell elongation regulator Jag/EloR [Dehalococcoidales bacterium]
MNQLNASREEIKVDVLSEGKSGIFGVGTEKAVIQVERLSPMSELEEDEHNKKNVAEVAGEILETLLDLMDIEATTMPENLQTTNGEEQVTAPLAFNIQGEDLGILIGRRGQTLAALQYVVRLIINQQMKVWTPVIIDVEGYKQRRSEALQALAVRMAEQVRLKGVPFTLEPMPAYERRIIHLALTDHPDITTESTGEGDARKVVISPDQGSQD